MTYIGSIEGGEQGSISIGVGLADTRRRRVDEDQRVARCVLSKRAKDRVKLGEILLNTLASRMERRKDRVPAMYDRDCLHRGNVTGLHQEFTCCIFAG